MSWQGISIILLTGALTLSCGLTRKPPEIQRHLLTVEHPAPAESADGPTLRLESVRVARLFERNGFIYRTAQTTFEEDFHRQFYAPPNAVVGKAIADWFDASPLFDRVLLPELTGRADWRLNVNVRELYLDLRSGDRALLKLEFNLRDRAGEERLVQRYESSVPMADRSGQSAVDAWSEGMNQILVRFEADVAEALSRP